MVGFWAGMCVNRVMINTAEQGRILRIILREPKKPQTYAQKQFRSMAQPSYA